MFKTYYWNNKKKMPSESFYLNLIREWLFFCIGKVAYLIHTIFLDLSLLKPLIINSYIFGDFLKNISLRPIYLGIVN